MTNRLSLARQNLDKTTVTAPVIETSETPEPLPSTTTRPFTTTPQPTTTTISTTTVSLVPFSYDEVSPPPPTAAEAAIIKALEEAVKIEHQRREDERIAASREKERIRSRRHSPISKPSKMKIPRCACGTVRPKFTKSIIPGLSSMRDQMISRFSNKRCRCLTMAQRRRLEELLEMRAEHRRKALAFGKCQAETVNRTTRDSFGDMEDAGMDQELVSEIPKKNQLPQSGRSKWFNFGRRTGGWGNGEWGRIGGQNNANTGGMWGRALPALGVSLFGNRAGTNTPPRSDSMPDLSMSGLNAQLLNLQRTPSATDLTRTNPTSASRTSSTATLVDVTPDSPSVLPSRSGRLLSRTASQEVASLTGTLPAAPAAAMTRARNDLYMPMSFFRPINPARGTSRPFM